MAENSTTTPTPADYQDALYSQGACNLSGLVHSLAKVMDRIWAEARANGKGTDYVNTHPIVKLYVTQLEHLASGCDYSQAYGTCEEKSKTP